MIETYHYRYKHKVLAKKMVVNLKVFATGQWTWLFLFGFCIISWGLVTNKVVMYYSDMFEAMLGWKRTILPNAHGQVWLDIKQQLWSVCEQTCGSNRQQECMAQKSPMLSAMFHGAYQVVPSSFAFWFLFAHLPLTRSIYLPWTLASLVGCWLNPHFFMAHQLLHHLGEITFTSIWIILNPIKP